VVEPDWNAIRKKVGSPGGYKKTRVLDPETLNAMRDKGYSLAQIADWFGTSDSTVLRRLRSAAADTDRARTPIL
jgi:DNA invertase Pin-like site-specific DNA recombinase